MTKTYSQARVVNPTSLQHVVWLQPGQTLLVNLKSDKYPNVKLDTSTSNIKMIAGAQTDDNLQFLFIQDQSVLSWSEYSSCHLGDIWIDSDDTIARLLVMLACVTPTKNNFVTIINPDCTDMRMNPQNVLEVILFDRNFTDQDEWVWDWRPNQNSDADFEQIGYDYVNINMWNRYFMDESDQPPSHPYARLPRCNVEDNLLCRQHHFWFRMKGTAINLLMKDGGPELVGKFHFYGFSDSRYKMEAPEVEFCLSVFVDLNQKHRFEFAKTLAIQSRNDLIVCSHETIQPHSSVLTYGKLKRGHRSYAPTVRDIVFRRIESRDIEDGCDVIEAIPLPKIVENDYPSLHVFEPPDCRRRSQRFPSIDFDVRDYHPYSWLE